MIGGLESAAELVYYASEIDLSPLKIADRDASIESSEPRSPRRNRDYDRLSTASAGTSGCPAMMTFPSP